MDPFSLTVGCISLIDGINKTTKAITKFVRTFREARKEMGAFNRQLSELTMTLEILRDETDTEAMAQMIPKGVCKQILAVLDQCNDILAEFHRIVLDHKGPGASAL